MEQTEPGSPGHRGSNSGTGVRVSGHRGRGSPATEAGSPANRVGAAPGSGNRSGAEEATESGSPDRPGFHSGDGGRATGRRSRGGSYRRVRPVVSVEGSRVGFARSTGRKRASPAETPSGDNDGRCEQVETQANARRSTGGGSLHLLGSPGRVRRRKPAAPPGAILVAGRPGDVPSSVIGAFADRSRRPFGEQNVKPARILVIRPDPAQRPR